MGELLGALGLAWPRLLLYPGGLSALALAWLLGRLSRQIDARRRGGGAGGASLAAIADALPPLLALALLPLPPARAFPYGIDLVAALALLGWPRLRAQAAAGLLAGRDLRVGYALQLLGAALMGAGAGGVELGRLTRPPESPAGWALLLGGAGLWLVGQARLVILRAGWAGRLGEIGQLWVGALPLLAALAALLAGRLPAAWAGWALPPLALLGAALVWAAARRRFQTDQRPTTKGQPT